MPSQIASVVASDKDTEILSIPRDTMPANTPNQHQHQEGNAPRNTDPYTTLSRREQTVIIILLNAAMLISPLTATIYLPLLPILSVHFHTSSQAINLTITIYIIFQALSPLLLATPSDFFGRRPIFLGTLTLYTLSSLGLALNQSNYPALLVLRALQSLGASAVIPLSYGAVADFCVTERRGKMLGRMMAAANLGTCFGPILGGWIASASGGYKWAFRALCMFGGIMLSALVLFLPETARNVVGNGSVPDSSWNQPLWILLRGRWRRKLQVGSRATANRNHSNAAESFYAAGEPTGAQAHRVFKIKSPLAVAKVLCCKDALLSIWIQSSYYAAGYCIQASIPATYSSTPYSFDELQVGLAYIPGAVGVILSFYTTSTFIDRNYRSKAAKIGFTIDKVKGDDLQNFPIEVARFRWAGILSSLCLCTMVGYGWSIERHAHVAVPLILQFLFSFWSNWLIQASSVLLVDVFPETPSIAATAGSMSRCVMAAIGIAVLQPLIDSIGRGWFFTMLGLISGLGGIGAVFTLRRWGMAWRNLRRVGNANPTAEGTEK
ncbi:Itaconic acid 2-hydroxyparaconate biosynthesis cluster ITP1 [Hyphodiscus hymeniophilus]|uniref:Itaconic acid 2-hydroxyparaconate biosynthesis cluster ITP1 n=1 Tax=Hyphodiscus hymeniophilus TaxID=353542 RepID=A0A9P6VH10_9HELO|nr:Itaconic acid 2-hydroxyparaconate biosynthesis cluster ITP1 [Hyphodiscus hymeniophilus]